MRDVLQQSKLAPPDRYCHLNGWFWHCHLAGSSQLGLNRHL